VFKAVLAHLLTHPLGAYLSHLFIKLILSVALSRERKHSFIWGSNFYEEKAGSATIILINEDEVVIITCIMNPSVPEWPGV
jgi:hypothetical protein